MKKCRVGGEGPEIFHDRSQQGRKGKGGSEERTKEVLQNSREVLGQLHRSLSVCALSLRVRGRARVRGEEKHSPHPPFLLLFEFPSTGGLGERQGERSLLPTPPLPSWNPFLPLSPSPFLFPPLLSLPLPLPLPIFLSLLCLDLRDFGRVEKGEEE
jgi:hypothetical protein